ncbi:E3 ubiquitin-protein ligase TRIM11-like [Tachyglossus aculeatus]|uniref:E3 ubiquitin-protein ligase TRIM11-like n=1 Tax=Tachyglossus aculeatus TaxID=9261 RepID=UPI0018F6FC4E|nr:E3 ubiquitin-protein ligase TRIM11-like [Tachyglossus aculeatus]
MDMSQGIREELTCSVCLEYFTDPVTIGCGHSFCQACLERNWGGAKNPFPCSECRKCSELWNFLPNRRLEKLAAIARRAGSHKLLRQEEEEQRLCEQHQQMLKLFCQEDETPLCIACLRGPEHSTHSINPVQEAVEEYKVKLQAALEKRWEDMQKVHKLLALEKIKTELWKEKVQQRRQTILSEFEKMREFLAEEQAQQLHNLALEEEKVLRKLEEMKSQVSQQGTVLKELIGHLEEKCEKPALELLQDIETLLSRSEAAELKVPWDVSVELRSVCHVFGMREMLCKFQVPMRLDEDTANPNLVLSNEWQSVKYTTHQQNLPSNPERFNLAPFVLGSQRFNSRRHYWEVTVEHTDEWILGVCNEATRRKGLIHLRPEHGFWTIALKNGNFYAGKTRFPMRGSPKMVGVYLNYEAKTVSFYNLTNRIHIYSYQGSHFSGSLCPIFAPCVQIAENGAGPLVSRCSPTPSLSSAKHTSPHVILRPNHWFIVVAPISQHLLPQPPVPKYNLTPSSSLMVPIHPIVTPLPHYPWLQQPVPRRILAILPALSALSMQADERGFWIGLMGAKSINKMWYTNPLEQFPGNHGLEFDRPRSTQGVAEEKVAES